MSDQSMPSSTLRMSVISIALGAVFGFAVGFLLNWLFGMWTMIGMGGLGMSLGALTGAVVGRVMEKQE